MGVTGALLLPLGARFADPGLEKRYRDFRTAQYFLRDDGFQATVRCGMLVAVGARELLRGHGVGGAALFAACAWPIAHVMLREWSQRRGRGGPELAAYLRHRTALVFVWRTVIMPAIAALWFRDYFPPPDPPATGIQITSHFIYGSGIVSLFLGCVSLPVLLEHHLVLQPLATMIVAAVRGPSFCLETVAAAGGPAIVLRAWRTLDGASRWVLSAVYMSDASDASDPGAISACTHVLVGAYVVLCVFLNIYVLWAVEHKSRLRFLAARGQDGGGGRRLARWHPVGVVIVFHAMVAVMGSAVVWQGLGVFVPGG